MAAHPFAALDVEAQKRALATEPDDARWLYLALGSSEVFKLACACPSLSRRDFGRMTDLVRDVAAYAPGLLAACPVFIVKTFTKAQAVVFARSIPGCTERLVTLHYPPTELVADMVPSTAAFQQRIASVLTAELMTAALHRLAPGSRGGGRGGGGFQAGGSRKSRPRGSRGGRGGRGGSRSGSSRRGGSPRSGSAGPRGRRQAF